MPPEEATTEAAPNEPRPVNLVRGPGGKFQRAPESFEERMSKMDKKLKADPSKAKKVAGDKGESDDEEDDEKPQKTNGKAKAAPAKAAPKEKADSAPKTKEKAKAEPKAAAKPAAPKPKAEPPAAAKQPVKTKAAPVEVDEDNSDEPAEPAKPTPRREVVEAAPKKETFTKERIAFDDWRRKSREAHMRALAQERESFVRERNEWEQQKQARAEKDRRADMIVRAYESDDPDGLAQAIGRHKDWNEMNSHFLSVTADPHYKTLRELRLKDEQRDAEAAKAKAEAERAKKQAEERVVAERQAVAQREHKAKLSASMAKSSNRLVAAMHDDPVFVNTVFAIQRRYYQETGGELSAEDAIDQAVQRGNKALREELSALRERLNRGFAEDDPEELEQAIEEVEEELAEAPPPARFKAPKTAVVPPSRTAEPAPEAKAWKRTKDPRWRQHFADRMAQADEEDEARQRQRRTGR